MYIKMEVEDLLKKIGKKFFVENYWKLKRRQDFKNDFTKSSNKTRKAKAQIIFQKKYQQLALESCINSRKLDKETINKAKKIYEKEKFTKETNLFFRNIDLNDLTEEETIQLYVDSMKLLKNKGIVRNKKISGEIGEYLILKAYKEFDGLSLIRMNASNKGFDAKTEDEEPKKYEFKTVTNNQGETGEISEPILFDYLVILKTEDFINYTVYELNKELYERYKTSKSKGSRQYCVIKLNRAIMNEARTVCNTLN